MDLVGNDVDTLHEEIKHLVENDVDTLHEKRIYLVRFSFIRIYMIECHISKNRAFACIMDEREENISRG
jgi:hypothetical protein